MCSTSDRARLPVESLDLAVPRLRSLVDYKTMLAARRLRTRIRALLADVTGTR
jgi:hypothetical protein